MTDEDLISILKDWPYMGETYAKNAADRIEALTAKLAKAVELLEEIEVRLKPISGFFFDTFPRREIKATLAEIKGGNDAKSDL